MKCPECEKKGLTSTITVLPRHENKKQYIDARFIDEEGKEHFHDLKKIVQSYQCTNHHFWSERLIHTCWCGWEQTFATEDDLLEVVLPDGYTKVKEMKPVKRFSV